MKTVKIIPSLGVGIYTMADVARYARMHYNTVQSWFRSRGVMDSDYEEVDDAFTVSFHDLLDTLIAHQFRKRKVQMKTVRRAYNILSDELGTPHPFCHRDLYADSRRIIIKVGGLIGSQDFQDAISKQYLFTELKEQLHNVSYAVMTKLAEKLELSEGVELNPRIAMGQPVLVGTGVTTHVVNSAFIANGYDREFVASLFGISGHQVSYAVKFEGEIRRKSAA